MENLFDKVLEKKFYKVSWSYIKKFFNLTEYKYRKLLKEYKQKWFTTIAWFWWFDEYWDPYVSRVTIVSNSWENYLKGKWII